MDKYIDKFVEFIMDFGPKLVGAAIVFIIGIIVIKSIVQAIGKLMQKRKIDPSLQPFLMNLSSVILKIMLIISVMTMIGIQMTSFIAILGAVGLAVGMALSGTLQNFAGGVMILIFKPFKVGDVLEAQGYIGSVKEIQIFNTILKTPDNKTIIIPNGGLSTGSMVNYSTEDTRRVDWTIGIGYGDDVDKAKEVINGLISKDSRIHNEPAPFIAVSELGDSSVNLTVRVWANASDYWGIFFDMNENVYKTFDKKGLNIPYPQMDVHVHKDQ